MNKIWSEKKSALKHMGFRGSGLYIGRGCCSKLAKPLVFQIAPLKVWCFSCGFGVQSYHTFVESQGVEVFVSKVLLLLAQHGSQSWR